MERLKNFFKYGITYKAGPLFSFFIMAIFVPYNLFWIYTFVIESYRGKFPESLFFFVIYIFSLNIILLQSLFTFTALDTLIKNPTTRVAIKITLKSLPFIVIFLYILYFKTGMILHIFM